MIKWLNKNLGFICAVLIALSVIIYGTVHLYNWEVEHEDAAYLSGTVRNIDIDAHVKQNGNIELFLRDLDTGVMARITGDNITDLKLEIK